MPRSYITSDDKPDRPPFNFQPKRVGRRLIPDSMIIASVEQATGQLHVLLIAPGPLEDKDMQRARVIEAYCLNKYGGWPWRKLGALYGVDFTSLCDSVNAMRRRINPKQKNRSYDPALAKMVEEVIYPFWMAKAAKKRQEVAQEDHIRHRWEELARPRRRDRRMWGCVRCGCTKEHLSTGLSYNLNGETYTAAPNCLPKQAPES